MLDGGDAAFGLESTIVKPDGDGLRLLRPGAVTPEAVSYTHLDVYKRQGLYLSLLP